MNKDTKGNHLDPSGGKFVTPATSTTLTLLFFPHLELFVNDMSFIKCL